MNTDYDTLSFGAENWTSTLPEEAAIKFPDLGNKVSFAASKVESG